MANEESLKIIGIKKAFSEKSSRTYTSYFCTRGFTPYEIDNTDVLGLGCETVQTTEDFPLNIGDEVIFLYGKAMGTYQPVVDFKMIKKAEGKQMTLPTK